MYSDEKWNLWICFCIQFLLIYCILLVEVNDNEMVEYILLWWSSCMSFHNIIKLVQQSRMYLTLLQWMLVAMTEIWSWKVERERERERSVRRNYRCDMFFVHITASSYLGNGFSNLHLADIIFSKICLVLCFEFIQRLEKKFYLMLLSEMGIQF